MEYKILTSENEGVLEVKVERAISDGWTIHGYTHIRRDGWSKKYVLSQAMVKDKNDE